MPFLTEEDIRSPENLENAADDYSGRSMPQCAIQVYQLAERAYLKARNFIGLGRCCEKIRDLEIITCDE